MVDTSYSIEEVANGLLIKSHRGAERWHRQLYALSVFMLVGIFSEQLLGGWWWTILAALGSAAAYMCRWGRNAQLVATNLEFVTTGNSVRRGRGHRIVCTGDVLRLEFRDYIVSGLYAVTERGGHCILPFLDYQQTMEVIRAIETRFPGLAEHWRKRLPAIEGTLFTSH